MNRLRSHFAMQAAQKPKKRLQSEIVAEFRDDIISLIADDGATLPEVADAVRAQGEPVLDPGFKAEVLKQIGTVKNIRVGRVNTMASRHVNPAPQPEPAAPMAQNNSNLTAISPDDDDDDDAFAARRPRR